MTRDVEITTTPEVSRPNCEINSAKETSHITQIAKPRTASIEVATTVAAVNTVASFRKQFFDDFLIFYKLSFGAINPAKHKRVAACAAPTARFSAFFN